MPPLLDKREAARVTTCLFPRSSRELPTSAGFSGLGGTEVKRNGTEIHPPCWTVTLTFSKPVNHCCFPLWVMTVNTYEQKMTLSTWEWQDNSGRQWRTEEPGMLQFMWSQRVGHDSATEQQQQQWGKKLTGWLYLTPLGILYCLKVHFISLHFYKRAVKEYMCSLTERNLNGISSLTKKGEKRVQCSFCSKPMNPETGSSKHGTVHSPACSLQTI